jgi:hypothetical protein
MRGSLGNARVAVCNKSKAERLNQRFPNSKQDVADEIADVFLDFAVLPNDDDQLAGEMMGQGNAAQLSLIAI